MFKFGDFEDLPSIQEHLHQVCYANKTIVPFLPIPKDLSRKESPKPKVWSSLFNSSLESKTADLNLSSDIKLNGHSNSSLVSDTNSVTSQSDELKNLAAALSSVTDDVLGLEASTGTIKTSLRPILPRGLTNRGSSCYLNAVLQSLIHCSPFRELLNYLKPRCAIPKILGKSDSTNSSPILQYMFDFLSEFVEWSPERFDPKVNNSKSKEGHDVGQELCGPSFTPDISLAQKFGMSASKEEDCEEFLTRLFTSMHEEMSTALKANKSLPNNDSSLDPEIIPEEEDWSVVGRSGKKKLDESNKAELEETPISRLFCVYTVAVLRSHNQENRAALQPFFILPLDIDIPEITSVESALRHFSRPENVDDYHCPDTGRQAPLQKATCVRSLPPVLVLQIKRFLYSNEGSQKNCKQIDIQHNLIIPKELLSNERKFSIQERTYGLQSIIFHIGKRCITGHYTALIYHSGRKEYLYLDDENITPLGTSLTRALQSLLANGPGRPLSKTAKSTSNSANCTPYLLIYSR